jgi:hypothetical protein
MISFCRYYPDCWVWYHVIHSLHCWYPWDKVAVSALGLKVACSSTSGVTTTNSPKAETTDSSSLVSFFIGSQAISSGDTAHMQLKAGNTSPRYNPWKHQYIFLWVFADKEIGL